MSVGDEIAIGVLDPNTSIGVSSLRNAGFRVHNLDAAVRVLAFLVVARVNLALAVRVLDGALARVGPREDDDAVVLTQLFAAVRVDDLLRLVGEEDLAFVVRVVLLDLAVRELENLKARTVECLFYVGFVVEVRFCVQFVVDFFSVTVVEFYQYVTFVRA